MYPIKVVIMLLHFKHVTYNILKFNIVRVINIFYPYL